MKKNLKHRPCPISPNDIAQPQISQLHNIGTIHRSNPTGPTHPSSPRKPEKHQTCTHETNEKQLFSQQPRWATSPPNTTQHPKTSKAHPND